MLVSQSGVTFHLMAAKRIILSGVLAISAVCAGGAFASPGDEQVAAYLKAHNMFSLLEIQLEDRIANARDKEDRLRLAEELAGVYLEQLKLYDRTNPYREIIVLRAQSLTKRMGSMPMFDLRLELLIDGYLGVESEVELARLELLDEGKRALAIVKLDELSHQLKALSSKIDPAVVRVERVKKRAVGAPGDEQDKLPALLRYRSLSHYYHAWAGYSLAVLEDRHVPTDVFISFGWLLGAKGELPELATLNESTLEYDHVARSAIGVAMAYAQSGDGLLARSWAGLVVESQDAMPDARVAAEDRLLQILAMDGDWLKVDEWLSVLNEARSGTTPMSVADARFLALRSLEAMQQSTKRRGGAAVAKKVARKAIKQLVEHNEIGHVLDLYRRFDSLPMLADSFITNYARALGELNDAEQAGGSGMYASVAALFAQALDAPDASRFPRERDDCTLKLAYVEIRSGRASEAIKICDRLIKQSSNEVAVEEARWMRIAAIDSINIDAGRSSSEKLELAVREYITAYPASPKSAKLILRHAMQGTVDPRVAIETLSAIGDDDPLAIPARRTLVSLQYKQLRANGFGDSEQIALVLGMVRWIDEREQSEMSDLNEAKARLGTIRVGLDLVFRASPPDQKLAEHLIMKGYAVLSFDQSLSVHRAEFVYRQVELSLLAGRLKDAMDLLAELESLDQSRAQNARVLLLNDAIGKWNTQHSTTNARRLVDLGTGVLAKQLPAHPKPMNAQVSNMARLIAQASAYLWTQSKDTSARDLALRMSLLVLDRGYPTEPGLRLTAELCAQTNDQKHELDAWLRLLAAYPTSDDRWYESRYQSLRVMFELDQDRARSAFAQFKVLHPTLGPAPWNTKIAALFGESISGVRAPSDRGAP